MLFDTAQRGHEPGTVSVIAPDRPPEGNPAPEEPILEPHDLDPAKVLRLITALGAACPQITWLPASR